MSIANDFMSIGFDDAVDVDVDIGLVDSDLDMMGYEPTIDSDEEILIGKNRKKIKTLSNKIVPDKVLVIYYLDKILNRYQIDIFANFDESGSR